MSHELNLLKWPKYIKPEALDQGRMKWDVDRDEWNKAMLEVSQSQAEYMEQERIAYNEIKGNLI